MKRIPKFWTTADQVTDGPDGQQYHLSVWGWSVSSVQEAAEVAKQRLQETIAKISSGGHPETWKYYPRMPLREETLGEVTAPDGALLAVVTRNRYGAEVLNVDAPLIADVDLPERQKDWKPLPKKGMLGKLFGRAGDDPPAEQGPDPAEQAALARVQQFAAANPGLGVSTYRTAAGLRVIVTGGDLPAGSQGSQEVLQQLDSDPLYVQLCRTHETYRARLTPKPWRVGLSGMWPNWPYPDAYRDYADRWLRSYQEGSAEHATCRLLSRTGPPPSAAEQQVLDLHDGVSEAQSGKPLA